MEEFYLIDSPTQCQSDIVNIDISGWPEIDLYSHWHRKISYSDLSVLLERSWEKSPYDTLKLLFHLRNCHGGKGERHQFYQGVKWFMKNHPNQILANFNLLPQFGYWKDLLNIWDSGNELLRAYIVYTFCQQLKKDYQCNQEISIAAKWAPTENGAADREWGFVGLFCEQLGWSRKLYRQRISKLRNDLNVTERLASDRRWGEIDFPDIPAKSRLVFHETLQRYCGKRYQKWCAEKSIVYEKSAYDTMAILRTGNESKIADSEWNAYTYSFDYSFGNTICVCDTSPSMDSSFSHSPINVAMALTLLISSKSDELFKDKVITFNSNPKFVKITGDTPTEKVHCLKNISWGHSLNLKAIHELLIKTKTIPRQIFIFTDDNFSSSQFPHNFQQDYANILKEYASAGLTPPEHIFYWNLGGRWGSCSYNLDYHDMGLIIINGFTNELFNTITKTGHVYPWLMLKSLLASMAYSKIRLV
uniref:DUF2828 family protein n=1 Tax=Marseillevirus LCMAC202 TaxID=2506606 RepID=A0A481YYB8_9VIRU|nr:MAG: protein of unknown function DUF2828 [Marseillevirus LCMAC202]